MKKFLIKLLITAFVPLVFCTYVLLCGVNHHLTTLPPNNQPFILGEPYEEGYAKYFKFNKNVSEYPLLAIGSSRVLQFKSEFFVDSFFNLGYMVGTPKQTLQLIEKKNIRNKTIIISLDQWAFNSDWLKNNHSNFTIPQKPNIIKTAFLRERVYDVLTGKIHPFPPYSSTRLVKIGGAAFFAIDGVINDGSHYYGKIIHGILNDCPELIGKDANFKNTLARIKKGENRFQFGETCDEQAISDLAQLITTNKQRGNKVYYFFPPYAPTIQKLLQQKKYAYISDAAKKIDSLAKLQDVPFYDFTYLTSEDNMYSDGFHAGAYLYYAMATQMGLAVKKVTFINAFELSADSLMIQARKQLFKDCKQPNASEPR